MSTLGSNFDNYPMGFDPLGRRPSMKGGIFDTSAMFDPAMFANIPGTARNVFPPASNSSTPSLDSLPGLAMDIGSSSDDDMPLAPTHDGYYNTNNNTNANASGLMGPVHGIEERMEEMQIDAPQNPVAQRGKRSRSSSLSIHTDGSSSPEKRARGEPSRNAVERAPSSPNTHNLFSPASATASSFASLSASMPNSPAFFPEEHMTAPAPAQGQTQQLPSFFAAMAHDAFSREMFLKQAFLQQHAGIAAAANLPQRPSSTPPVFHSSPMPVPGMSPNSPSVSSPSMMNMIPGQQSFGMFPGSGSAASSPLSATFNDPWGGMDSGSTDLTQLSGISIPNPTVGSNGKKVYKCPRSHCTKIYKNANGLKYHMLRGQCEIDSLHADGEIPEDVNMPVTHRRYWCRVAGCGKKYKNLNGLKYHVKASHPSMDYRILTKNSRVQV